MYRTLIEATAFGTRKIIETFVEYEIPVDEIIVAGGIAQKNPFMMQIYADVTGRPIRIAGSDRTQHYLPVSGERWQQERKPVAMTV